MTASPAPGVVVVNIGIARIKAEAVAADIAERADTATDVAIGDWDRMLRAVEFKLRSSAGPAPATVPHPQEALDHMRTEVLECVAALDQLHATISQHIERSRALEGAVAAAQAALAEVRRELASSHAEERAARRMAVHDNLTELPNGAGFRARLVAVAQAATRGQAFAVLYIDLDGFKAVNEMHGHAAGDHLLRIIVARLASEVRAEDMLSRLDGDEFACLLWLGSPARAALTRLARSIFAAVSAPLQVGALSLSVRPSIGIAIWPGDGMAAEHLLEHADTAMHRAKRQQSGHAFFDQC
jgi:diguanylate cyclase